MTRTGLRRLGDRLVEMRPDHPLRVGIDGVDGAGKTTLADDLVSFIRAADRACVRVSLDGFHRPRAERYRLGEDSPEGYYRDSYDLDAVLRNLLLPLGPGGDRRFRRRTFEHRTDRPIDEPFEQAPPDAVLLLDGIFLHRPELLPHLDATVFVRASFETVLARVALRDATEMGGIDVAIERYRRRYIPAQRRYLAAATPESRADAVVMNDDADEPTLELNPSAFDLDTTSD